MLVLIRGRWAERFEVSRACKLGGGGKGGRGGGGGGGVEEEEEEEEKEDEEEEEEEAEEEEEEEGLRVEIEDAKSEPVEVSRITV